MLTGLRSRLNTLDGTAGEGNLISVWLDHDYRDAVLIPVAAGAAPVVVELLHRMANALQVKIMLIGGTLAVGGVTPAVINTFLDDADVAAWLRPALPTTRLLLGPASALGDTLNNNVNWCARLQGKTCHGLFVPLACRTLTPLLQPFLARWGGGAVTARSVVACDPDDEQYRPMTMVRIPVNCQAAMDRLASSGSPVWLAGCATNAARSGHARPATSP